MGAKPSIVSSVDGFQIGRVLPNSPSHISGLCPFFDIITGVDDIALDLDSVEFFKDYVSRNVNNTIRLNIFNLRVRVFRVVPITPSASWGGVGLLGCAMEWCNASAALELTWHIEGIDPRGPAAQCSELSAGRDYIIGMQAPDEPVVTLFTHSTFSEKMEGWRALRKTNAITDPVERETLLLLVFDSESNTVKEVAVAMGNHTSLGVEIADGYLHFIPELAISDPSELKDKLPYVSKFVINGGLPPCQASDDAAATDGQLTSNDDAVAAAGAEDVGARSDVVVGTSDVIRAEATSVKPIEEPTRASEPVTEKPVAEEKEEKPQEPEIPAVPTPAPAAVPAQLLPTTTSQTPPKPPSFPSFLPSQQSSKVTAPAGLPFPSFNLPPTVRPQPKH